MFGNLGFTEFMFILLFGGIPAAVGVWLILWARGVLLRIRDDVASLHARLEAVERAQR